MIIGTETIVDKSEQKDMHWTLSAMAMHLLRTLEQDHEPENLVGEHLIPCCGHHIDHLPNNPMFIFKVASTDTTSGFVITPNLSI